MNNSDIALLRLQNQCLAGTSFEKPEEVVRWLGAVQAQDYAGARWALGMRMCAATDSAIEQAFNDGAILRTHVLRPTWHFLTAEDIRWVLALSAPRVHLLNGTMYRGQGLDPSMHSRIDSILIKALEGGQALTREELSQILQQNGINTEGTQRLAYIIMRAELDGLICSGPRRGKQFTYMLLDERAPHAMNLDRDGALAELVRRYFRSHGPATVHDFVWWSGLTVADTRQGLEMVQAELVREEVDGQVYWFAPAPPPAAGTPQMAYLLPNYDELGSHKDRSAFFDPAFTSRWVYPHLILVNGRMVGTWKRTFQKRSVIVEPDYFIPLSEEERQAVLEAAGRYGEFLGVEVELVGG